MELTPANIRTLRTSFNKSFQKGYDETDTFWQKYATMVPSASRSNTYGWMASLPGMKEWTGDRVVENLSAHSYEILNRHWEQTIEVDRNDIADDNMGVYSMKFEMAGTAAANHPDALVEDLFTLGNSTLCFDGQFFFDTDHPVNGKNTDAGTYSNYHTSFALDQANFLTRRAAMFGYTNEHGRSLKVRPTTLIVPPALEGVAIGIVAKENTNGSNTTYKMADYHVVPELAGADTTWYMADLTKPIKPFVYQLRQPLKMVSKGSPEDQEVLQRNKQVTYADQRDAAGYTLPFLMTKNVA